MTQVRRLGAAGAGLALAAVLTCAHVWGGPGKDDDGKGRKARAGARPDRQPGIEEDLAATKFTDQKVLVYDTRENGRVFGWQLQPKLDAVPARPRDVLVLVDTSASQAGPPLATAIKLAEAISNGLGAEDRLALWTVNLDVKKLTKSFQEKGSFADAFKELKLDFPAGAANLKKALAEAAGAFDLERGRQRVVVLLGDGMSLADPLDAETRNKLAADLVRREVAVFPVPLGNKLDPINLHGLASATGGVPVRLKGDEDFAGYVRRLFDTVAAPILYPEAGRFGATVAEAFPTKFPPLRADTPTLIVGKVKDGAAELACTLVGTIAGREVKIELKEPLAKPEVDNFFLAAMVNQWREARDQPALLKADRALAFAYEQNCLARAELITQAEWALQLNKLDAAWKLYEQAQQVDPNSVDAEAGKAVLKHLKAGKMTLDQLKRLVEPRPDDIRTRVDAQRTRQGRIDRERLLALAQRPGDAPPPPAPMPPPGAQDRVKQQQIIEDQRNADLVDDAIREAARLLRTNPDAANELLKRTREGVLDNPDISARARANLANRLRDSIRNNAILGVEIKRDLADQAQRLAVARERLGQFQEAQLAQDRLRERMNAINQLIARARFEIVAQNKPLDRLSAIRAAEKLRADLLEEGKQIPPELIGQYTIAQSDFHLTELNELRRLREQRFLLTLLEVERRHMPFPDEPPVEFPPAAQWKALTTQRKSKYESFRFGAASSNKALKRLLDVLNAPVKEWQEIDDPQTTLEQFLKALSTRLSRPNEDPPFFLTFEVNEPAFKNEGIMKPLKQPVSEEKIPAFTDISPANYLRRVLSRINLQQSGSPIFIIRKESDLPVIYTNFDERDLPPPPKWVVEITTEPFALDPRSFETVGYSVADLVVPIPNAVNAQSVQQSATLFGQFGLSGGVIGQFGQNQLGLGALGAGALGVGALGVGGLGVGGLGQFGLGALGQFGQLGQVGALGAGVQGNLGPVGAAGQVLGAGQAGVQGANNFGVGGGFAGFGGGQLGQFGNLGGQFGLQGGTQEGILILTIRSLIGTQRDWAPVVPGLAGPGQLPNDPTMMGGQDDPNANPLGMQLGYFPSALALVVKGTSLIRTRITRPSVGPPGGAPMGAAPGGVRGGDAVAANGDPKNGRGRVAGNGEDVNREGFHEFVKNFKVDPDPKKGWQEALDKGVDDPGVIVATADYLFSVGAWDHAIELLKANLRRGVEIKPWVYEAMAQAMRQIGSAEEEIARVDTSPADLEPQDPESFLSASKALARSKKYDFALAFCRQAALLEPNAPQAYADALSYAEMAKDAEAIKWAAGGLLKQDWPMKNEDLHARAADKLNELAKTMDGQRAKSVQELARSGQRRDLSVRLRWQGQADLDLKVEEPSGSLCSCLNRQTVGGGTLVGDLFNDKNAETYVAARGFPGKYTVTVDKVWGQVTGDKVELEVVLHQGTDKETTKLMTVDLKADNKVTVELENGRRTEAAAVPAEGMQQAPEAPARGPDAQEVLNKLRKVADPELVGRERNFNAGVGSLGSSSSIPTIEPLRDKEAERASRRKFQNRVAGVVDNGVSFTTQGVISGDRRSVRMSVNAVFNVTTGTRVTPRVSVIPGGP